MKCLCGSPQVHSLRLWVNESVGNYHSPFPPHQVTPRIRAVTELSIDPCFCVLFSLSSSSQEAGSGPRGAGLKELILSSLGNPVLW